MRKFEQTAMIFKDLIKDHPQGDIVGQFIDNLLEYSKTRDEQLEMLQRIMEGMKIDFDRYGKRKQ